VRVTLIVLTVIAFERAVYATKSFVIALALCKGRLSANEAADASHVEVRSQIEKWGEVEDCKCHIYPGRAAWMTC
jgi:chaperone required for assembly of F1-ATPase